MAPRVAIRAYNGAAGIDSIAIPLRHEFELATTGTGGNRRLNLRVNEPTLVGTDSWVEVPVSQRPVTLNYVREGLGASDW
jgi:hypothetical protein